MLLYLTLGFTLRSTTFLPREVRNRLEVYDRLGWLSHPMAGFTLKVSFDPWEPGGVWGSLILEHHVKPDQGYRVSVQTRMSIARGLPSTWRNRSYQNSADKFWGPDAILNPEVLHLGDPRALSYDGPQRRTMVHNVRRLSEEISCICHHYTKYYEGMNISEDVDLLLLISTMLRCTTLCYNF